MAWSEPELQFDYACFMSPKNRNKVVLTEYMEYKSRYIK